MRGSNPKKKSVRRYQSLLLLKASKWTSHRVRSLAADADESGRAEAAFVAESKREIEALKRSNGEIERRKR